MRNILATLGTITDRNQLEATLAQMARTRYETVNDVMDVFDTPQACVERLLHVREELGVGRVIAWFNFGGQIPHERVLRSMELFAARVVRWAIGKAGGGDMPSPAALVSKPDMHGDF